MPKSNNVLITHHPSTVNCFPSVTYLTKWPRLPTNVRRCAHVDYPIIILDVLLYLDIQWHVHWITCNSKTVAWNGFNSQTTKRVAARRMSAWAHPSAMGCRAAQTFPPQNSFCYLWSPRGPGGDTGPPRIEQESRYGWWLTEDACHLGRFWLTSLGDQAHCQRVGLGSSLIHHLRWYEMIWLSNPKIKG